MFERKVPCMQIIVTAIWRQFYESRKNCLWFLSYSLNSRKLLQIEFNRIKAFLIKGVNKANRIIGLWLPLQIFVNEFFTTSFCAFNETIGHCVKSVHIRSFSGLYFSAFGLNTEYLSVFSPNAGKYGPENSQYGNFSRSAENPYFNCNSENIWRREIVIYLPLTLFLFSWQQYFLLIVS